MNKLLLGCMFITQICYSCDLKEEAVKKPAEQVEKEDGKPKKDQRLSPHHRLDRLKKKMGLPPLNLPS